MMNLIAAALAAAAPAAPSAPASTDAHAQHKGATNPQGEHKGMDCCKDCCKDMAKKQEGRADDSGRTGS